MLFESRINIFLKRFRSFSFRKEIHEEIFTKHPGTLRGSVADELLTDQGQREELEREALKR